IRPERVKALLAATSGNRWEIPIRRLASITGMRRSEVLGLPWQQVDLDASTIRVTRSLHVRPKAERRPDQPDRFYFEEPRTEAGRRTIRMPSSLIAVLRRHRIDQAQRRLTLATDLNDHDL